MRNKRAKQLRKATGYDMKMERTEPRKYHTLKVNRKTWIRSDKAYRQYKRAKEIYKEVPHAELLKMGRQG
jgi:hypothetical protein